MKLNSTYRKAISTTASIGIIVVLVVAAAVGVFYYSTLGTSSSTTTTTTSTTHTTTTTTTSAVSYKSTIVIGTTDSVQTTLDPADAYDYFAGSEILPNIGDGLVDYKPGTSQYVPALATDWSVSPNGTVWTFNLRQGVHFPDGTPFNATTVKYSVDRQFAIQEASGPFVGAGLGGTGAQCCGVINHTVVTGTYQIKFYLNSPFTAFLGMAAFSALYPVDPAIAKMPAHPNPGTNEGVVNFTSNCNSEVQCRVNNPNGLGAYLLTKWDRAGGTDVEMDLTANPSYWNATNGAPKTQNIVIKFYADSTSLALALSSGEIDLAYRQLGATDVNSFMSNSALHVWTGPGAFIQYLVFNQKDSAFTETVRQAVAAAINRTAIVTNVFQGEGENLYSMIPIGMAYHTDAFKTAYGEANTAKAETLLTQAGYSTTHKLIINLTYPTGHYTSTDLISQQIKQALEATGMVTVNLQSMPWSSAYRPATDNDQLQVYLYGWYPDYVDPFDYTNPFFPADGVGFLHTNWVNSTMNGLITTIASTSDTTQLSSLYGQVQDITAQAAPVVPLFQLTSIAVSNTHVSGVVLDITQIFKYDSLQETA
jgi:peptide/nickel transport system substrate-binding protein